MFVYCLISLQLLLGTVPCILIISLEYRIHSFDLRILQANFESGIVNLETFGIAKADVNLIIKRM